MREFVRSSFSDKKDSEIAEHRMDAGYEYLVISVAPQDSLAKARARLLEHSELGQWELQRSVIFYGGRRKYWMRRRAIKVVASI